MDKQLKNQLAHFIDEGRVCLLGIGNRYHHDDAFGPYLAEAMESRPDYDVIDAGIVPEDYIETAAHKHPASILMVDATDLAVNRARSGCCIRIRWPIRAYPPKPARCACWRNT